MSAARVKRYVDEEGQYLIVEGMDDGYCIGWWVPEWFELGLIVNNVEYQKPEDEDTRIAVQVCHLYFQSCKFELPASGGDFIFPSEKHAKACLRQINIELNSRKSDTPLPEWAKTALANGWTPPKNWKP
jgi:hypothetical protein